MILGFGTFYLTGGGYSISESRHGFVVNMPPGCPNPNTSILCPVKKLSVLVSAYIYARVSEMHIMKNLKNNPFIQLHNGRSMYHYGCGGSNGSGEHAPIAGHVNFELRGKSD